MPFRYTKKVIKHFMHPKNVGIIKNADGVGKAGNILCGDEMWIYIKVSKNKKGQDIIKNIKFQTLGCPAAIATTSVITELAKNKKLNEVIKITNKDVIKRLGKLPPLKYHCSLLAEQALSEAIYNYLKKNKLPIPAMLQKKHAQALKIAHEFDVKFKQPK